MKLRRTPPLRAWRVFSGFPGLGLREVAGFREAVGSFFRFFLSWGLFVLIEVEFYGGGVNRVSWGFMGLFMGVFGFVKSSRVFCFLCVCVCVRAECLCLRVFVGFRI